MKRLFLLPFTFLLLTVVTTTARAQDATDIMRAYRAATAIDDLTSRLTYTNVSKRGRQQQRTLQQYISRHGHTDHYRLVLRFVAPHDVAGTATLTVQHADQPDEQWLYLPALRTSRRISASRKADRFMGTEMTYEDLSTYLAEPLADYRYRLLGVAAVGDRTAYRIEATPREGVATQYGKRVLWIDQETHLMLRTDFYDRQDQLLKVYTAENIRQVGDGPFFRAHRVTVRNERSGGHTKVEYQDFAINQGVDPAVFSTSYLETE